MQTQTETTPQALKPSEVAKLLRVHKCTIYAMIRRRDLRAVKIGGTLRIPREAVAPLLP